MGEMEQDKNDWLLQLEPKALQFTDEGFEATRGYRGEWCIGIRGGHRDDKQIEGEAS